MDDFNWDIEGIAKKLTTNELAILAVWGFLMGFVYWLSVAKSHEELKELSIQLGELIKSYPFSPEVLKELESMMIGVKQELEHKFNK